MNIGDTYRDRLTQVDYEVTFDGRQSLITSDVSRPSSLQEVSVNRRAWTRKVHRAELNRRETGR